MDWLDRLLELIGEIMALLTRNGGPRKASARPRAPSPCATTGRPPPPRSSITAHPVGIGWTLSPMNAAAATLENTGAVYGTPPRARSSSRTRPPPHGCVQILVRACRGEGPEHQRDRGSSGRCGAADRSRPAALSIRRRRRPHRCWERPTAWAPSPPSHGPGNCRP
jgi:hypothetical protein